MFELELITFLNDYKKSDENTKNKILKSISNLIKENNDEFNNFISKDNLDEETKKLLKDCSNNFSKDEKIKTNEVSDFELIKNYYIKWENIYNQNNKIPNTENEKIVLEIINFYVINRFDVLEEVLKIKDSEDYESFKNMLKNYLRKYFAEKISNYYKSDNFKDLGFFEKRKKKNKILDFLAEIGQYKFDIKKMEEILK